jgi:hypothetical protein
MLLEIKTEVKEKVRHFYEKMLFFNKKDEYGEKGVFSIFCVDVEIHSFMVYV